MNEYILSGRGSSWNVGPVRIISSSISRGGSSTREGGEVIKHVLTGRDSSRDVYLLVSRVSGDQRPFTKAGSVRLRIYGKV